MAEGLLFCGGLRIDFVISAAGEVRLNQMGGNAIYAAVGARTWTEQVRVLAKTGENFPQEWLDALTARGVNCDGIVRVPGWQETRTFYAYADDKIRMDHEPERHFARLGLPLPAELEGYTHSLKETFSPTSALLLRTEDAPSSGVDAVHISPLSLITHSELVGAFRRQGVQQITVDPGEYRLTAETEDDIKGYCAQVDAFLPSELELGLLLGSKDPYEAAEIFGSWGPPLVVIKRGPDGCLLYERDAGRFTTVPAYPTTVRDVTGAGDSFGGAFMVGLRQTGDPLRAVLMGTVAASFTIQGYGALQALDTPRGEAEKRLAELSERVKQG